MLGEKIAKPRIESEEKPTIATALVYLQCETWKDVIRWNAFDHTVRIVKKPPWTGDARGWHDGNLWTGQDTTRLIVWFERVLHLKYAPDNLLSAVMLSAQRRPYHPVRDWLQSIQWDGQVRIPAMLSGMFGAQCGEYAENVGVRWMVSAIARIMAPGCKADCVLVLEGEQGRKKSLAVETLCGSEWFTDSISDLKGKDAPLDLAGKWIVELSELATCRRSDQETLKSFMSRRVDHYRPPYERTSIDVPRQNVFCGTTNEYRYLEDITGGRRFWGVRVVGKCDIGMIAANREQLWAEALTRYESQERWWMEGDEEQNARTEQERRRVVDPWEAEIADIIALKPDKVECTDKWILAQLNIDPKDRSQGHSRRIGGIMRNLGYTAHKVGGKNIWESSHGQLKLDGGD